MTTQIDDLSRSLVGLEQDTTLIAAAAIVSGLDRQPQKKLKPDPPVLEISHGFAPS